ncbi:hypothetical protein BVRB_024540 [Beta vulgaris subsp. vulgaris]|uniref:Uncharacterized protein n=1 Tax=Beta vulgaris subsp. vulgaris TaxID=3555 RepID=A0A0J8AZI1_BETVV|nr:hypothetical protein BVRB_024540 [Beta vulgaris subsp. vulgaris]
MAALNELVLVALLIISLAESSDTEHGHDHDHHFSIDHDIENGNLINNVVGTDNSNSLNAASTAKSGSQTGQELHAFSGKDTPDGIPGIGDLNLLGDLGVMPTVSAVASTSWTTSGSSSSTTTSSSNNSKNELVHDDAIDKETKDGIDAGHHSDHHGHHHR